MGRRSAVAAIILLSAVASAACSSPESDSSSREAASNPVTRDISLDAGKQANEPPREAGRERPTIRTNYQGEFVSVPSDPAASYRILDNSRMPNGNIEVFTRRDGREGTSYLRWEIDCAGMAFRHIGGGVSIDDALKDSPTLADMSALTKGSAAADLAQHACP